jgi:plasmid stability protein
MAQILVRQLPDEVKERLREKALRHGRSLEDEARTVLSAAAFAPEPEEGLGTLLARLFKDVGLKEGEELELPPDDPLTPANFEE